MNELVTMLCTGDHPVDVVLRPSASIAALRESLERGFVHLRFRDTRGGTELGVVLDREKSYIPTLRADAANATLRIVGEAGLDYVAVRCVAEIDIATFSGRGRLEPSPAPPSSR